MIIVTSLMAPPFLKATIDRDRAKRAKAGLH
jgi:hypothetical protein